MLPSSPPAGITPCGDWLRWCCWLGSPTVMLPSLWLFPSWQAAITSVWIMNVLPSYFTLLNSFSAYPQLTIFLTSMLLDCLPCSNASPLHFPPPGMPEEQREGLQEELIDIILLILERNPQLHYYQGYHDIVVTFLLVLGERLATSLVEKLSTHHLRYPHRRAEDSSPRG